MSDIETNDPTPEAVTTDPVSVDDGTPTDDSAAPEPEAPSDGVTDEAPATDVTDEAEAADTSDVAPSDDEMPSEDESTEARGVEGAEGGDDVASTEAVDADQLLEEQAVVVDNPYTRPGRWFVVHTQSGYEKKVKQNLEARIHSMNAEEAVYEVVIPMEDYVDFKNGKRVVNQRKMFPGYLLVRAELDDQAWFVIRNTPGVTGFVGQGAKPSPLPRRDVEAFLTPKGSEEQVATRAKPRLEYEMGETVRVKEGPFADFSGEVIELNEDQLKLKVLVNIFGRETPVELEFSKVAKL